MFPLPSLHLLNTCTPCYTNVPDSIIFSFKRTPMMRFLLSLCVFLLTTTTAAGVQTSDCNANLTADGTVSSLSSPCEQWTIDCRGDVQIMWTYYQSTDYVFIYKMDNLAYPAFSRMGDHGQDVTVLEGPLRVTFERNATEGGFEFDYKCLPSSDATCEDVDVDEAINGVHVYNSSEWNCRNLYCQGTLELLYSVNFIGEFAVWNHSQVLYVTQAGISRHNGLLSLNVSGDVRVTTLRHGEYTSNGNWAFFRYGCNVRPSHFSNIPRLPPTQEVTCNSKAVLDGATGTVAHMNYDHSESVCWELACEHGVEITWTSFDTHTSDYVSMYEVRPNSTHSRMLRASGIHNGTNTFGGPLLVEFTSQRSGDGLGFEFDYTCLPSKVKKTCTPVGVADSVENGTVSVPVPAAGVEQCWSVSCYGKFQVSLSALDYFGNFSIENTTHTVFHTYTGYMRSGLQNTLTMTTRGPVSMSISGRGCADGRCGSAAFAWECNPPRVYSPTGDADDGHFELPVGVVIVLWVICVMAAYGVVMMIVGAGAVIYVLIKSCTKPSAETDPSCVCDQEPNVNLCESEV